MFVKDRMTKNPVTVTPSTKVDEAALVMKKYGIRRLPVVEDGKLVGFLSDRDLMKATPSPATTLSKYEINSLLAKMTVKGIMSRNVVTISVDATIEEAALLMCKEKIGGMPVVSSMGAVVGVITETDIFRTFVDVMGLLDGKTRLTLLVKDKIGVVRDVSGIFTELGLNIDSLVTCKVKEDEYELVVRGDFPDMPLLGEKLKAHGYEVFHSVKIG